MHDPRGLPNASTQRYCVVVLINTEYQQKKATMARQMTEMLKGTLEGIVLAVLARRPAYGYEITAWLRDQGFADTAEGTVYALLIRIERKGWVDVTKVPSEKGPPRKVYALNAAGREHLAEFWRTWDFLAGRLETLRDEGTPKR